MTLNEIVTAFFSIVLIVIYLRQNKILDKQTEIFDAQVRLELFEKRFEMFQQVLEVVVSIQSMKGMELTEEFLSRFNASVAHGQLILSDDVWQYVSEVRTKLQCMVELYEDIEGAGINVTGVEYVRPGHWRARHLKGSDSQTKRAELLEWFLKQEDVAIEKFGKDLDLRSLLVRQGPTK